VPDSLSLPGPPLIFAIQNLLRELSRDHMQPAE